MEEQIISIAIICFTLISILGHITAEYCEDEETEYFCRKIGRNFLCLSIATLIIFVITKV